MAVLGPVTDPMSLCPHCQHPNPPGTRFCAQCGAGLEIRIDEDKSAYTTPVAPGTIFDGKYQVLQEIGRGGMGVVYRGHDLSLGRLVAIKVLPEQFNTDDEVIARFKKEARAMAALDHPNIVPVYAIGQQRNFHYFVMKFLEGATVAEHLEALRERDPEKGRFEPLLVRRVLEQACRGLDHAHKRGLVHRDVKPGNLMISAENHCTIMDFGIVKEQRAAEALTREGLVFGTPEYMAPEQAQGQQLPDATADIYSLGVVAYEMLAGRPPFQADTPFAIVLKHIKERPASLVSWVPGVTPAFEAVLFRAMAKRPEDRFSTALQMAEALDQLALGAVTSLPASGGRPVTVPPPLPSWPADVHPVSGARRVESGPPPRVREADRPAQVLTIDEMELDDDFEDGGEPDFLAPPAPFGGPGFDDASFDEMDAPPLGRPADMRPGVVARNSLDLRPPLDAMGEIWPDEGDEPELDLDLDRPPNDPRNGRPAGDRLPPSDRQGSGQPRPITGAVSGRPQPAPIHRNSASPRAHVPVNTPRGDTGRSDPAVLEDRPGHYRHLVTARRQDLETRARKRRRQVALLSALAVGLLALVLIALNMNR